MMDAEQLKELATNAQLGHWPPHLGVRTDAEKVEYLARALESTSMHDDEVEGLETRIEELDEETVNLNLKIDERDDKIEQLEDQIETLTDKNEDLQSQLKEAEQTIAELEARL